MSIKLIRATQLLALGFLGLGLSACTAEDLARLGDSIYGPGASASYGSSGYYPNYYGSPASVAPVAPTTVYYPVMVQQPRAQAFGQKQANIYGGRYERGHDRRDDFRRGNRDDGRR